MRVSGKNFVLHVVRPVKPPQLLADFAALVAVLKSSGGVGAQTCGAMAGRIGGVVSRLVIALCFHVSKICKCNNAGGGEVPPPASRLLWFEKWGWHNVKRLFNHAVAP